jgi:hypothetical protein
MRRLCLSGVELKDEQPRYDRSISLEST